MEFTPNTQGAERVFLTPRLINPRAIHVYEKVGFKREGVLRHFEKFEGQWIEGQWIDNFNGAHIKRGVFSFARRLASQGVALRS